MRSRMEPRRHQADSTLGSWLQLTPTRATCPILCLGFRQHRAPLSALPLNNVVTSDTRFISLGLGSVLLYLWGYREGSLRPQRYSVFRDGIRYPLVRLPVHLQAQVSLHPRCSSTRITVMIISTVELQTLRTREVQPLAQGHTANKSMPELFLNHTWKRQYTGP